MTSIYYVGTYKPMMCGIADYTDFIVRESDDSRCGVISFDLDRFPGRLIENLGVAFDRVWYGIPDFQDYSASIIQNGLQQLGADNDESVLWFQHENGLWQDNDKFISMLSHLRVPKVVTLHTIHFQSSETPSGLRRQEHAFLQVLLRNVDAITVFSDGCQRAITDAFPEHWKKVYVLKHGIHSHPETSRLSRMEAKEKLNDFLLFESDLDEVTKAILHQRQILLDPDTFVMGETGFLCSMKQSELLFLTRDIIQEICPNRRIIALRIGSARDSQQGVYASTLRSKSDGMGKFLLDVCLPEDMLRVAQRAFDVNFYWPKECSQSGILAHALGIGGIIAGRRLEGSGEMLDEAGAIVEKKFALPVTGVRDLILKPELGEWMEEKALNYAETYSWANQVRKHYDLAEHILNLTAPRLPLNLYWDTLSEKVAVAERL